MTQNPLTADYVHVPRFAAGSKESVAHLESEGFVVIANALAPSEAEQALDLTWEYLESLGTGVDRGDVETWHDDRWPVTVHGGIIPSQGIGHSSAQWYIRSAPAVKQAFAAVWDDDDLLVSFDGMALWRPTDINPDWATGRGGAWLHVDQHPIGRPGRQCVQGAVTLTATSPEVGGNIVVPAHTHGSLRSPSATPSAWRVFLSSSITFAFRQMIRSCKTRHPSCAIWKLAT